MDDHLVLAENVSVLRRRAEDAEAANVLLRERIDELEHQLQEARS